LFMKTVLAAEPWREEPALTPLPWRDVKISPKKEKPLRLGVMWHDRMVLPHPPVTRALKSLVERLKKIEHVEVVDFAPYKHDEGWAIYSSLCLTDGGQADLELLARSGEPVLPLTEWMMRDNPCSKNLDRQELEYWLEEREEFRLEYAREWNSTGRWDEGAGAWNGTMDALLCPVAPWVATRHGTARYWPYTSTWNLLDYPALAFPVGTSSKDIDGKERRQKFMSEPDRENWSRCGFGTMQVRMACANSKQMSPKFLMVCR
jgi:amidase